MEANGSLTPVFETDDDRTAYLIRLPVHPLAAAAEREAEQVTGQVTVEVARLLEVLSGDMSRQELQQALELKHRDHFNAAYLTPALRPGMVEMTLPDMPRSSKQRYRLTAAGTQAKVRK